jgi:hypothetical protein
MADKDCPGDLSPDNRGKNFERYAARARARTGRPA